MGATANAINLSSDSWATAKPKDYKGKDLDTALAGYEAYRGKTIQIDASHLTVSDLKTALAWLEKKVAALEAIRKACDKTAAELRKSGKEPGFEAAANFVDGTQEVATKELGKTK